MTRTGIIVLIFRRANGLNPIIFQFTVRHLFIKRHISTYKQVAVRFASLLGLRLQVEGDENSYRRLRHAPVKRLPDALVIGVKKCGTRALLEFLR